MAKLQLPTVTLCAVTSVNVAGTVAAMESCLEQVEFGGSMLLTDAEVANLPRGIRRVPISGIRSAADYSEFLLRRLADHVSGGHVLIVQWDGFVLDASRWDPQFLDYDYVGAPWPQFDDGHDVGNGGFSLRSARLLQACKDSRFQFGHPEDVAIGRINRRFLEEERGCRFPEVELARRFSFERTEPPQPTFGFHGIFNMIPALGADRFWEVYSALDERTAAQYDYALLMRQLGGGPHSLARRLKLTRDRLSGLFRR